MEGFIGWVIAVLIGCATAVIAGHVISTTDYVLLTAYALGCGSYIMYSRIKGKKS